jgi:polysaccharide biosynthesis protein PslG
VFGVLLWVAVVAAAIVPLLDDEVDRETFEAAPLPAADCPGLELGVNSSLAFQADPGSRAATVAALEEQLGASVVRDSLLWHEIEPVEGERNWARTDGLVEDLRAAGIEPTFAVFGSPSWANGVAESTPDHYLYVPPRGPEFDGWLQRYSDFLAAAVERYQGFVRRWEIWNEPNLAVFWPPRPDPAAYRQVYETLRATILRVDPAAEVAVGGLGALAVASNPDISGLAFLRHLARAEAPLDNVAVHAYTSGGHAPQVHVPGERNFGDIALVHDRLVALGERAPLWVTEWGWSSAAVGEERQARYVDRALSMLDHRYPFVELATYFADQDRPPDVFFGLLDDGLEPKPAALAFRRHAELAASRCAQASGARP